MAESEQESSSSSSSVIFETIVLIFYAIRSIQWSWYLSWLVRIIAFPFKLLFLPVRFIGRILLVVLSPALYTLSYTRSCVAAIVDLVISFEPLYNLFGSAALIGIIAGIVLGVSSNMVTSYLGMHDKEPLREIEYVKDNDLDALSMQEESSSNEADWQWLDRSPSRRRPASGLLTQTIHEEEDDENDSDAVF